MFSTLYVLLLLLVVLFSWIANMYGLLLPDGEVMPSILSADGTRWLVRHSLDNVVAAPVASVLLVLMMVGMLRNIGLVGGAVYLFREHRFPSLSPRQRYASRVSWGVFGVLVSLVLMGILVPGGNLLSVTGHIVGGPLSEGWLFVLFGVISVPCLLYGWMAGMWRTERDVLNAFSSEVARCSSYFVTLIVASQLVGALHYIRLFELIGWGELPLAICVTVLYGLPLIISLCRG